MGSNLLKITMGRGYQRMMLKPSKTAYPETMQYLLNQGSDARNTPHAADAIDVDTSELTLAEVVSRIAGLVGARR